MYIVKGGKQQSQKKLWGVAWPKITHFKDTILNPKYSNQYCTALGSLLHMNEHRLAEGGDTLSFSLCLTLHFQYQKP